MSSKNEWVKLVFSEPNGNVNVIQGVYSDLGDFIQVEGDYKTVRMNKLNVVSITNRHEGKQNDTKRLER
jgi:hypothetical protein